MKLTAGGLSVRIDTTPIVTDADLVVGEGQLAGLVGPNGCGKSTLLRTIYRAVRPVTGVVRVGGDDVWRLTARQSAQRTAVVAQETSADFELTAYEVVNLGRSVADHLQLCGEEVCDPRHADPLNHGRGFQDALVDCTGGAGSSFD